MSNNEDLCSFNGRVRFSFDKVDVCDVGVDAILYRPDKKYEIKRTQSEMTHRHPVNFNVNEKIHYSSINVDKSRHQSIIDTTPIKKESEDSEKKQEKIKEEMTKSIKKNLDEFKARQLDTSSKLQSITSSILNEKRNYYQIEGPRSGDHTVEELRARYDNLPLKHYIDEFEKIRLDYGATFRHFSKPENAKKNYYDQRCYDYNRVKLKRADKKDNNYINANYVDGFLQNRAYICTQCPRDGSVNDFWLMVWQEHSHTIVMLNKIQEIEDGRVTVLSSQYWPCSNQLIETEQFIITNINVVNHENYKFELLHVKNKLSDQTRTIRNWQFFGWPEDYRDVYFKVSMAFYMFVSVVRYSQKEMTQMLVDNKQWDDPDVHPPIIVHSANGCHRTGLFCAMYCNMNYLEKNKTINIKERIKRVREQRYSTFPDVDEYILFITSCVLKHSYTEGNVKKDEQNDTSTETDDDGTYIPRNLLNR